MHNWDILRKLNNTDITFKVIEEPAKGSRWLIEEYLEGECIFSLKRSKLTLQRYTETDKYGLIGLSTINLQDTKVILTEGVSDFFTMKIKYPHNNVLGFTTLSGSRTAKQIIINLFDQFLVCSDNDANSDTNTGVINSSRISNFLRMFGKSVKVIMPETGFKDMTEQFVFELKLRSDLTYKNLCKNQ